MNSQKNTLETVELDKKIQVNIPKKVLNQIRYLCHNISEVEWSGIGFYELKGDFDSGEFSVEVKDIFPMNMGSSGYTEYEFNEDFIKYRMSDPKLLDYNLLHVHSHNNMNVFFSQTDMGELKDNAPNYNYYLSLIVNNNLDMEAKIAFIGEEESSSTITRKYTNSEGKVISNNLSLKNTKEVMFVYNCDVNFDYEIEVEKSFSDRVQTIIQDKIAKDKAAEEKKKAISNSKKTTVNTYPTVYQREMWEDDYWGGWDDYYNKEQEKKIDSYTNNDEDNTEDISELLIMALSNMDADCEDFDQAQLVATKLYNKNPKNYLSVFGNLLRSMIPSYLGKDVDLLTEQEVEDILEVFNTYATELPEQMINDVNDEILSSTIGIGI